MSRGPSYDIQMQKFRQQELRLKKYDAQVAQAERDLPKKKAQIERSLVQARQNVATLRDYARKEAGQKGKVDGQVRDQMVKINESAVRLAKQAREGRANISKWRMASFEAKRMAIQSYHLAVENWWDGVQKMIEAQDKMGRDIITSAVMRASRSMQLALMGRRGSKWRVVLPVNSGAADRYPGTDGIEAQDKRIAKIRKQAEKLEGQIGDYAKKIAAAREDLMRRRTEYHGKIDAAVGKRVEQIKEWKGRVVQLEKAKVEAKKREALIAKERARVDRAKGSMARGRRSIGRRGAVRRGPAGQRRTQFSR